MKNNLLMLSLIIMLVSTSIQANEIKPFGGINWDDSFDLVLKKIIDLSENQVSIRLRGENFSYNGGGLTKIVKKRFPNYFDPKRIKKLSIYTYKDKEGIENNIMSYSIEIHAKNIIISGVPFDIEAEFEVSRGIAIVKPENVVSIDNGRYMYPLFLKELSLSSKSPLLLKKYKRINKILLDKYSKFNKKFPHIECPDNGIYCDGWVSDSKKHQFSLDSDIDKNGGDSNYLIIYSNSFYDDKLKAIYKEHLAELIKKQNIGKKDTSNLL